jgi:hypothetical protein
VRQVLTNAAREGARFAVAPTSQTNNLPNDTEIIARVNSFLTAASVTGATVTTMCPLGAPESCTSKDASMSVAMGLVNTDYTKVTVTKSYTVFGPIFNSLAITLKGEAIMRRETSE